MIRLSKKMISTVTAFIIVFLSCTTTYASDLNYNSNQLETEYSKLLDSLDNTQSIQVKESDLLIGLINTNQITRAELNNQLFQLSNLTSDELQNIGYNMDQINLIKNYDGNSDALMYTSRASALITFRYGLAGSSNSKKRIKVAFDIRWSSCPFFTFTDSFGIGWIAADSNSKEIMTETLNAFGESSIYSADDTSYLGSRVISLDTNSNGIVTGNPVIGSANGGYTKLMGGTFDVQTQSGSYNIQTIQIYIAYAHTYFTLTPSASVTIGWDKVDGIIRFTPSTDHEILVADHHNFYYNSQDVIVAEEK